MNLMSRLAGVALALVASCAGAAPPSNAELKLQVANPERAFAATMRARVHAAFTGFLAEDTVLFMGSAPLHGKVAVAIAWKRFYDTPAAPFFCGSRKKSKCWRPARWQSAAGRCTAQAAS